MSDLTTLERSCGDHRIVWEVLYAYDMYHRVDDGHGDTVPAGKTREQKTVHIIAATRDLVRAAFDHKYPARCAYQFIHANPLCTIDYEIGFTGYRHFT